MAEPCGCTTIDTLLKRTSRMLNDDVVDDKDTQRWPRATLLDFLNEGLTHLQSLRPDAFTDTMVFELSAGKCQTLPKGVSSLVAIESVVEPNADGSYAELNTVLEENQTYAKYFSGNKCAPGGPKSSDCTSRSDYKLGAFSTKGSANPRNFNVSPPVPSGKSVMVKATVVKEAPCYCIEKPNECVDLPTRFHASLVDWMLYRAYGIDIESEYALRSSTRYESSFYRFISNGYMQEARFASGYFNGQDPNTGNADVNVTAHSAGIR